jgi:hypothetical protein
MNSCNKIPFPVAEMHSTFVNRRVFQKVRETFTPFLAATFLIVKKGQKMAIK